MMIGAGDLGVRMADMLIRRERARDMTLVCKPPQINYPYNLSFPALHV